MRLDPNLSFLSRCGPPNGNDIQEELKEANKTLDHDESSKLLYEDEDRWVG